MKLNFKLVAGVVLGLAALIIAPSIVEEVDAGEIVVIQYPFTGSISVVTKPGICWQWGGKATHYKRENQFWFLSAEDKAKTGKGDNEIDNSVSAIWNDGGKSSISGSVRWAMPIDEKSVIDLHSNFGTQEAIEAQLVKTNVDKAVFLTGPLMSSKESYAEKRGDLIYLVEDQANKGVYRTKTVEVEIKDEVTNDVKKEKVVEVIETNGIPQRQEQSTVSKYNLKLYNVSINSIKYDKTVDDQIKVQQQAIMA